MRSLNIDLDYECPRCGKETIVDVEAESPSDYYFDNRCPECGAKLDEKFMDNISSKIVERMYAQAEAWAERDR